MPGGDVRIDERVCALIKDKKILTLANKGRHVLLELPEYMFIDISFLLEELFGMGITAIISHPERNLAIAANQDILLQWEKHKPCLQFTAASFLGHFGRTAQELAWQLLEMDWPMCVATDCHNLLDRAPRMKETFELIISKKGEDFARLLCIENPLRIIEARELLTFKDYVEGDNDQTGDNLCRYGSQTESI